MVSVYLSFNYLNQKSEERLKLSRSLILNKLTLNHPAQNEVLKIDKPSDKITYQWELDRNPNVDKKLLIYHLQVFSPFDEILIDDKVKKHSMLHRNFFMQGEYRWSVTPIYKGIRGQESQGKFTIVHPKLDFIGEINKEIYFDAEVSESGSILLQNNQGSNLISWMDQSMAPEEKFLIEISRNKGFYSLIRRVYSQKNYYEWDQLKNGTYFFRVTRVSAFNTLGGTSNIARVFVEVKYPSLNLAKYRKKAKNATAHIVQQKYKSIKPRIKKTPIKERETASIKSKSAFSWGYFIPKEVMISLGQGDIELNQVSESTNAESSFSIQNILFETKFQHDSAYYIDVDFLTRSSNVQNMNDFSDTFMALSIGKDFELNNLNIKPFASLGVKYNKVNYFEQSSTRTFSSNQETIFSASAQLGLTVPMGEKILNKLRIVVDIGDLSQYGLKYNGRYKVSSSNWFVDVGSAYYDGTYTITDEFNKKNIDRSEVQIFMGVGRSFK